MAFNKIILMGNLTRDVEIRYSQGGSAIGNTGIATNRKWKSQTGEQKEEVMFVDLTFFGRTAEIANQYLRKGSKVLVDGRLSLDQWTAQDGTKRSKHVVIVESLQMLGGKDDQPSSQPQQNGYQATPQNNMDDPNRHNGAGGTNRPANHQQTEPMPDVGMQEEIPF